MRLVVTLLQRARVGAWGIHMLGKLGPMELLVILAIALLIFGPSKLADLGKGLGEGIRNFKSAVSDGKGDAEKKP